VDFSVSCKSETQDAFNQSVAMLHHMMYEQSREMFLNSTEKDPDCAMLHWGVAMTYLHPLWAPPSEKELQKGLEAVERAESLGASTQRERDYIDAIKAFFGNWKTLKHGERITRWEEAQEKIYRIYPEDLDALAFYALSHLATAPKADKTFSHQKEAGKILEDLNAEAPEHPAGFHYLIHAYDNPMLAQNAVEIARGYNKIAPDVPHALHMPTHIFVRLGLWGDVVNWNRRSADAAWKQPVNGAASLHYAHAMDYLVYGNLQVGDDVKALEALEELNAVRKYQDSFASAYAIAAAQARFPLERSKWAQAADLEVRSHPSFPWDKYPWFESIIYFARGLGAARSGDIQAAEKNRDKLDVFNQRTQNAGQNYWAVLVDSQRKSVGAWIAFSEGGKGQAVELMRRAADLEDSVDKHPVTPGAVLPARELLGDMLLNLEKFDDAIQAYETSLEISTNRLRSLYGAGRAAELSGSSEKAKFYYSKLLELTAQTTIKRPEVKQAETFLGKD
jgi:tetratricopeptide (TPR) repeat protein